LGAAPDGGNEVRCYGLKHQKEKRSMDHFAGLDVSVKETSVCIVDDTGKILREVKVASEPEALLQVLRNPAYRFKRIGLEAGPLSQWLFSALAEAGLPVICVETRHMRAALKAPRCKASVRYFCRFEAIRSRYRTSTQKAPDNIICCGNFRSTRR
jgi:transposase